MNSKKDIYDGKREYAARLRYQDKASCFTLSEAQHDVLAEVASIRHDIHTGYDDIWLEDPQYLLNCFPNDLGIGRINELLSSVNLNPISLSNSQDWPNNDDWFCLLDDDERAEWEEAAELLPKTKGRSALTGYELWSEKQRSILFAILDIENDKIEQYLKNIDAIHGTHYAPTGMSRLW